MAKKSNYFAYNIIDSLYYGRPVTEEDMIKTYGKKFHRRSEWPVLSEEEKNNFDIQEKEFIKTVIDKYITDNNKSTYFSNYYNNNEKTDITYTYIDNKLKSGIELSDMICNINGMHVYKLLSAKDIDFDNVILPNSTITNDETWGIFDPTRRWENNSPVRINNIFELFNVIDYLLCACNNIWTELNRLKYNNNDSVNIWFVVNASNDAMIVEDKKIYKDDFKKENIGMHQVKLLTTLDPSKYYINLNVDDFGVGTNFYKNVNDGNDIIFTRNVENKTTKNITLADINNILVDKVKQSKTTTSINGELVSIYGYSIGNDLKIYPGAKVDTIINDSNIIHEKLSNFEDTIIDYENKKLKYDIFFRPNPEKPDLFKRVYIEFLYNYNTENPINLHSTIKHPYILYYINDDDFNKKVVLYVQPISTSDAISVNLVGEADNKLEILRKLSTHIDYDIDELYSKTTDSEKQNKFNPTASFNKFENKFNVISIFSSLTENYVPLFYIVNDCYSFTFQFITPNTNTFSQTLASITIYYYKKENNITNGNIYLDNNTDNYQQITTSQELKELPNIQKIEKTIDINQSNKLSYSLERYNIPEKRDIYFEINASYIANGDNENPFNLLLDDEYNDIPLFNDDFNNLTQEEKELKISSYYYFNGFTQDEDHKRVFIPYNESNMVTVSDYQMYDISNRGFYHIWDKIENPYHLTYEITYNSTINDDNLKSEVLNEINNINLTQLTYNIYHLNYTIEDEDIEQLQYDINFIIDETSKVKRSTYVFPINLNKILDLSINYTSYDIQNIELEKYGNYIDNSNTTYKYKYNRNISGNITEFSFKDILNMYGSMKYSNNTYQDIVKLLNDNIEDTISPDDKFTYDNTDSKIFSIIYDDNKHYVNLLGGYYLDNKIEKTNKNTIYIHDEVNNNEIFETNIYNNPNVSLLTNSNYLFNINGFGYKYRLHGLGDTIYITNSIINNSIYKNIISSSFDILCASTELANNSIIKKLNFKFSDQDTQNNSYQLSYITYLNNDDKYVWTYYENDYKIGHYDDISNEYSIKTIPFDIIKSSYSMTLYPLDKNIFDANDKIKPEIEAKKITTYIPISYMYVKSSTFYPPLNCLPNGEYDLNNPDDIEKYTNYIDCWDKDNYHPITMSMQLEENYNNERPYFSRSNEAKMKFNILRDTTSYSTKDISVDTVGTIFVGLNSRYYLSDLIKTQSQYPSGSYAYYDEYYGSYIIQEIKNTQEIENNISHNIHYNTIDNPIKRTPWSNYDDVNNSKILYPIFNINNSYMYDIYRVSDMNKYKLNIKEKQIIRNETVINIEDGLINDESSIIDNEIYIDNKLSYIDINNDILNKLEYQIDDEHRYGRVLLSIEVANSLHGSKNYKFTNPNAKMQTIFPTFNIITREISDNDINNFKSLYHPGIDYETMTIDNRTFEFFDFKYNDIYYINNNDNDYGRLFRTYEESVSEDIPITQEELRMYYKSQLTYFLDYENYKLCSEQELQNSLNPNT